MFSFQFHIILLYSRQRQFRLTVGAFKIIQYNHLLYKSVCHILLILHHVPWLLTLRIVEKNPTKFKIDNKELTSRKNFIEQTREEVKVCTRSYNFKFKYWQSNLTYLFWFNHLIESFIVYHYFTISICFH